MKKNKKTFCRNSIERSTLILLLLLCVSMSVYAKQQKVLFISSYNPLFPTFSQQIKGLEERLVQEDVLLDFEFMDTKRLPGEQSFRQFEQLLIFKFSRLPEYDAVITGDDNATRFAVERKDTLFADLPIIFLGVNDLEYAQALEEDPGITGVVEYVSMHDTIEIMQELHPNCKEIVAIADGCPSSNGDLVRYYQTVEDFPQLEFSHIDISLYSWDQVAEEISSFEDGTLLLLLSAYTDKTGDTLLFNESLEILTRSSKVPIYHLWEHGIGMGLIGGKVVSHRLQGQTAAELTVRMLERDDLDVRVPIVMGSPNTFMFDHLQLKRFDVGRRHIPKGAVILNRPVSLWVRYKEILLLTLFIISSLIIALVISFMNIRRRMAVESQLIENRDYLAASIDSIGEAILFTDSKGVIHRSNRAASEIFTLDAVQKEGLSLDELGSFRKDGKPIRLNDLLRMQGASRSSHPLVSMYLEGAQERFISITCSSIMIAGSEGDLGFVLIFIDITEEKKTQDHLQRSAKLESIGLLAAGIAHDFNNLLGGLFGYIELARLHLSEQERCRGYLDKAEQAFVRSKDLTQQLLTFSKGGKPVFSAGDLKKTIREAAEFVGSGSPVQFQIDLEQNLWSCRYDENQIKQVLDNLLINAMQAMGEDGVVEISAGNEKLGDEHSMSTGPFEYVCITIRDSGCGIPQEDLNKVFDPFFTTKELGTGLGLSTCYSIVQKHHGTILLDSEVGHGTTCRVYLPRDDSQKRMEGESSVFQPGRRSGRVLVLDDESSIREIAQQFLGHLGYEALCFEHAEDLLQEYHTYPEDVNALLVDITVPGGFGGERILQLIREADRDTPVYAMSGYADNSQTQQFAGTIQKPFTLQGLARLLDSSL